MLGSANHQEKVTIKISGMSCNHCVQRIEKAYIEYDPTAINTETLLQIIKDSGYEGVLSG
jgi:copper chaperone CopZ